MAGGINQCALYRIINIWVSIENFYQTFYTSYINFL